jgi:hypothetical protein
VWYEVKALIIPQRLQYEREEEEKEKEDAYHDGSYGFREIRRKWQ